LRFRSSAGRLQQIPFAAPRIGKDRDDAVRLASRFFEKAHATRAHGRVIAREIVGFEKVADAATGGRADRRCASRCG